MIGAGDGNADGRRSIRDIPQLRGVDLEMRSPVDVSAAEEASDDLHRFAQHLVASL